MSLAPTLKTELKVSVGVGLVATAGLIASMTYGFLAPAKADVSVGGLVPTITTQVGPVAQPDQSALSLDGLVPFLQRIRNITTGLPDSTPEQNDLTPTLVWGDFVSPSVGLVTTSTLVPALITNGGQTIFVTTGSAITAGLVPTVTVPAGQDGSALASRGVLDVGSLVPSLELIVIEGMVAPEALAVAGLAPTLVVRLGWQTVALAGTATWVDVPTV